MLRILIVEDDATKLRNVVEAVCEVDGCDVSHIDQVSDAVRAKRLLGEKQFDLMIVDLHIPNRIDQAAKSSGGVDLLRSLLDRPSLRVPSDIVAVTGYQDAYELIQPELGQVLGVIRYDATATEWREQLKLRVRYAVAAEASRRESSEAKYGLDLAILTALDDELAAVLDLPIEWQPVSLPGDPTRYRRGTLSRDGVSLSVVAATASRMGMASAASLASKIIAGFRPRYICMAGIAGGIRGRVKLGDVLIADPSWDWGSGKYEVVDGKPNFAANPEQVRLHADIRESLVSASNDEMLLARVKSNVRGTKQPESIQAHVKAVASGAAVLGDEAVVEEVKIQSRTLHGVEMEIYGLMVAADLCSTPRPIAFSAKAVSDYADVHKDDSVRSYACQVSANFLFEFAIAYLAGATVETA